MEIRKQNITQYKTQGVTFQTTIILFPSKLILRY